jgi:hypothetical protein
MWGHVGGHVGSCGVHVGSDGIRWGQMGGHTPVSSITRPVGCSTPPLTAAVTYAPRCCGHMAGPRGVTCTCTCTCTHAIKSEQTREQTRSAPASMLTVACAFASSDAEEPQHRAHCVRCPACVNVPDCAARVRRHPDCSIPGAAQIMCLRFVYHCEQAGVYFTHPMLNASELDYLRSQAYPRPTPPQMNAYRQRVKAQHDFIAEHVSLSPEAHIVEVGCSRGHLLGSFSGERHRLTGFEPSPDLYSGAVQHLHMLSRQRNSSRSNVRMHGDVWSTETVVKLASEEGIDLFIASQVVGLIPNFCSFAKTLYASINAGGAVFLEVPNVSKESLLARHTSPEAAISWATPLGLAHSFAAAGFQLGTMQTFENYHSSTQPNGMWIRTILYKPFSQGDTRAVHGIATAMGDQQSPRPTGMVKRPEAPAVRPGQCSVHDRAVRAKQLHSLPNVLSLDRKKTVALVGPAAYIEGAHIEPFVRAAHVVARPNVRLSPDLTSLLLPRNTTDRVDVVYHSGGLLNETVFGPADSLEHLSSQSAFHHETMRAFASHGVRAVVHAWAVNLRARPFLFGKIAECPKCFDILAQREHNFWSTACPHHAVQLDILSMNDLPPSVRNFTTGMRALYHILEHLKPAKLGVFGFSFYQKDASEERHSFPGYYQPIGGVPEARMGESKGHSPQLEMDYLHQLLSTRNDIFVDTHLEKLMKNRGLTINRAQVLRGAPAREWLEGKTR